MLSSFLSSVPRRLLLVLRVVKVYADGMCRKEYAEFCLQRLQRLDAIDTENPTKEQIDAFCDPCLREVDCVC